jgi:hypothetical protein
VVLSLDFAFTRPEEDGSVWSRDQRVQQIMSENVRSMVFGPSLLYGVAVIALVLTIARRSAKESADAIDGIIRIYLVGIAFQCLHFTDGIRHRLLCSGAGVPWLRSLAERILRHLQADVDCVVVARRGRGETRERVAYFPLCFFAVGMVGNAVWHPLLCLAIGGYFPGLFTSPLPESSASCCYRVFGN